MRRIVNNWKSPEGTPHLTPSELDPETAKNLDRLFKTLGKIPVIGSFVGLGRIQYLHGKQLQVEAHLFVCQKEGDQPGCTQQINLLIKINKLRVRAVLELFLPVIGGGLLFWYDLEKNRIPDHYHNL